MGVRQRDVKAAEASKSAPRKAVKRTEAGLEPEGSAKSAAAPAPAAGSTLYLAVCVLGIYGSFLTWAVLQERISTTPYGVEQRVFRSAHAISAAQSLLAFLAGLCFLGRRGSSAGALSAPLVPRGRVLLGYAAVAVCQTLSSPLSYASLQYVDYITMLLAKSCKLVPVMAVHLTLYRTRFPAYKYVVVALVTLGVSLFSLGAAGAKTAASSAQAATAGDAAWGFALLGGGLFLDGLYNTTQDQMFKEFGPSGEVTGPHMMVVLNLLTTLLSTTALVCGQQWTEVRWFAAHAPQVFTDLLLFAACGAVGQIFIFLTLERFGSLVLVTTTVTRKMISMLLSVVLFNHRLTPMQWGGVVLVFGGIAGEALYKQMKS